MDVPVRAFLPDPAGEAVMGRNGQRVVEVYSSGPRGSMPDARSSAGLIVMRVGTVSAIHTHLEHEVKMACVQGHSDGALTLYGDRLEHAEWIVPGGVKVIAPCVTHVAVYPRPAVAHDQAPDLHVIEFKSAPRWDADTYPVTGLESVLVARLHELGLLSRVTLDPHRAALVSSVTGQPLTEFVLSGRENLEGGERR